ncbi:hypothetical protein Cphy_0585 [Lachnoclostridium phytofermentans ISDg]|uniref:Uncharacterized protein n=2 Tax=Lachnoclostridium phytofermentans TaxID=66219 RepID=A9KIX3_LACP7|nr:hypothetical protein Cphy_0585 [Lachnoclostridium phytofermentans ISDg]
MAAIEYGINGYGIKIYPWNAYSGRTYICPYCLEEIHFIAKSHKRVEHFKHKIIKNRTPVQMMCPGYRGTPEPKKIDGDVDKAYITNGGISLYICESLSGKYEIRAIFPLLSHKTIDLLQRWGAKVSIQENGTSEMHSACNLKSYKVKSNAEWINIQCSNMKYRIDEIEEKWKWGIRGINPAVDIFHSNYQGGYRVALYSNIIVGKEYLIISKLSNTPCIKGMSFDYSGSLAFNSQYSKYEYYIYSMVVKEANSATISYIQKRGYQLIEQSDEIIPMWPPAIIEGKQITYRKCDQISYLYHKKKLEQELFYVGNNGLCPIPERNLIFQIPTDNKTILLSEYSFHKYSNEIRVILTNSQESYVIDNYYAPRIGFEGKNSSFQTITQIDDSLLYDCEIKLLSDYEVKAYLLNHSYVELSSRKHIGRIKHNQELVVDAGVFGVYTFDYSMRSIEDKIDLMSELNVLRLCNGPMMPVDGSLLQLLEFLKPISSDLYQIIYTWIQNGKMPVNVVQYVEMIKEKQKYAEYKYRSDR